MIKRELASVKELSDVLHYDPFAGVFYWKKKVNRATYPLRVIGTPKNNPKHYPTVCYKSYTYLAHRVAWALYYGDWPKCEIDHINGNRQDNRIDNLRDVSVSENQRNAKIHRAGRLWGASKVGNRWQATYIEPVTKKRHYLGLYKTEQEAHQKCVDFENNRKQK